MADRNSHKDQGMELGVDRHQLGLPDGQSDADAAGNKDHHGTLRMNPRMMMRSSWITKQQRRQRVSRVVKTRPLRSFEELVARAPLALTLSRGSRSLSGR